MQSYFLSLPISVSQASSLSPCAHTVRIPILILQLYICGKRKTERLYDTTPSPLVWFPPKGTSYLVFHSMIKSYAFHGRIQTFRFLFNSMGHVVMFSSSSQAFQESALRRRPNVNVFSFCHCAVGMTSILAAVSVAPGNCSLFACLIACCTRLPPRTRRRWKHMPVPRSTVHRCVAD